MCEYIANKNISCKDYFNNMLSPDTLLGEFVSKKIEGLTDSITKLEFDVLDLQPLY